MQSPRPRRGKYNRRSAILARSSSEFLARASRHAKRHVDVHPTSCSRSFQSGERTRIVALHLALPTWQRSEATRSHPVPKKSNFTWDSVPQDGDRVRGLHNRRNVNVQRQEASWRCTVLSWIWNGYAWCHVDRSPPKSHRNPREWKCSVVCKRMISMRSNVSIAFSP